MLCHMKAVFGRHKRFSDGHEGVQDYKCSGRLMASRTEGKLQKFNKIVWRDRRLSMRMIVDMVKTNKESVGHISHDELKISKSVQQWLRKNLLRNRKTNGRKSVSAHRRNFLTLSSDVMK